MKLVFTSDTHNKNEKITIPDGDLLLHSGDATMGGTEKELIQFNEWMGTLPHQYKLVIAGNHDWLYQRNNKLARSIATNFTYLEDEQVIIDDFKFYGMPWQPTFFHWAFNLDRNSRSMIDVVSKIPLDTHVLLTHGPAFGHLDLVPNGNHVGCEILAEKIHNMKSLLIHSCGHIHHSYGMKDGPITRINASICNESYEPNNEPIVVEL